MVQCVCYDYDDGDELVINIRVLFLNAGKPQHMCPKETYQAIRSAPNQWDCGVLHLLSR